MKIIFYFTFLLLSLQTLSSFAGDTTNIPYQRILWHDKIKAEQKRADKADGKLLGFEQDEISIYAHHVLTVGADPQQATEINLIEFADPATVVGDSPLAMMNQVGISRLALLVLNAREAFEKVRVYEGVEIVCEPKDIVIRKSDQTFTMTWFSFRDPFGVFITMAQPPKP